MTPSDYYSKRELIDSPRFNAPHVVLLGAGASKAACENGDRNGRLVPLMNELPCVLGDAWRDLENDVPKSQRGFEAQFTWLRSQPKYRTRIEAIEELLYSYFQSLQLPDHATLYDHLVLGLRQKDIIATFNWDPFLMLAHQRNRSVAKLPEIRFLHGSVLYASCTEHDVLGVSGQQCPRCGKWLDRGKLLFPDNEKDYTANSLISRDWRTVEEFLSKSFHLTIFGYSGPATDHLAKESLLKHWKQSRLREYGHVEIIDISSADELRENWKNFIPFHHKIIMPSFWDSTIAKWPRRTAEYKFGASLEAKPSEQIGPCRTYHLKDVQEWYANIARMESSGS